MSLIQLEDPRPHPPPGPALFALGFRPFYLMASVFAALTVPLWSLQFSGRLGHAYLAGPMWHAHEMVFGFTLAVIVGFLFTAGRNWSQRPTPTGTLLAALALLWLAGRVLVMTPYAWAAATVNVAFPLAAACSLAVPFWQSRNQRNYFFVGLLMLMAAAAAAFHLAHLGILPAIGRLGMQIALDAVLFIVVVMAGRVIPMFTNNGVPQAAATRKPLVETASLGAVLALALADAMGASSLLLAALCSLAALAHFVRWWLWQPWKTFSKPLVWVLHVSYLWIPVHFALRLLAEVQAVPASIATHALTTGAIGGLVIGMMTRTAKGHTGRPLRAGGADTVCYVLVLASAAVRVGVPLVAPQWLVPAVQWSAGLWSAAFALYAVCYLPVLTRARVDGKPG